MLLYHRFYPVDFLQFRRNTCFHSFSLYFSFYMEELMLPTLPAWSGEKKGNFFHQNK